MRLVLVLLFSLIYYSSNAQIELLEIHYSSNNNGSVKGFWNGKINGNKSQKYEAKKSSTQFKLKWNENNSPNKVRVYFYFLSEATINISKIKIIIDGEESILKGENILKIAHFNYQLNVQGVSNDRLFFSRTDLSGNSFLEFTEKSKKLLDELEKSNGNKFNISAKSKYDFISKAYSSNLDNMNYSQLPSIVFLPKEKDSITEFGNVNLSKDKSVTFHITKKTPVDLNIFEINDTENNIIYSDSSIYKRLSLSNNLSLQLIDGYVRIKRNEFNDDYALININLDPQFHVNFTYHLFVFSSAKGNSVMNATLYDRDRKYSFSELLNSSNGICEFPIYSENPIEKLIISYFSNTTDLPVIDSLIINDKSRQITEVLFKNDFRYHISESKKISRYESKSYLFSNDRYKHKLLTLLAIIFISLLLKGFNSKFIINA